MRDISLKHFPEKIELIIVSLVDYLKTVSDSIILYGSAAQNKMTYRINGDKWFFYSDIEFYIIPSDKDKAYNKSFRNDLIKHSNAILENLDFIERAPTVDIYPVNKDYFINMDNRISSFELKNSGIVLMGEDYLKYIPDTNINNYKFKIQNIEVVKSLKVIMLQASNFFLHTDSHNTIIKEDFIYFLYSSYLNILRTLVPLLGFFELDLQGRLDKIHMVSNTYNLSPYFEDEILNKFKIIAENKNNCQFFEEPLELLRTVFIGYKSLLCMQLKCEQEFLIEHIELKSDHLFFGSQNKIAYLSQLTCFFLTCLETLLSLLENGYIADENIKNCENRLDKLIMGVNAYKFMNILDKYSILEKERWKIIGSKD